eukprot:5557802-Alexandrium_andersonii.AAC.1
MASPIRPCGAWDFKTLNERPSLGLRSAIAAWTPHGAVLMSENRARARCIHHLGPHAFWLNVRSTLNNYKCSRIAGLHVILGT